MVRVQKRGLWCVVLVMLFACGSRNNNRNIEITDAAANHSRISSDLNKNQAMQLPQWIGRGFDALTGEEREFCFDPNSIYIDEVPVQATESIVEIVRTSSDVFRSLNIGVNLEASGVYKLFTGSGSLSTTIMRDSEFSSDEVMVVAQLIFKDKIQTLDGSLTEPELSERKRYSLEKEKGALEFRQQCGDLFTQKVTLGSRLVMVFKATNLSQLTASKSEVEAAIKVGFAAIFGLGVDVRISEETSNIFNQLVFSSECYTEGVVGADICADFMVDFGEQEHPIVDLNEKFQMTRQNFADSIALNPSHVKIGESYKHYETLNSVEGGFFSYEDRSQHLTELAKLLGDLGDICRKIDFYEETCSSYREKIEDEIKRCANQSQWQRTCAQLYPVSEYRTLFSDVLDVGDAGSVKLFRDADFAGQAIVLDCNDLYNQFANLIPGKIYNLDAEQYRFSDQISSIKVSLEPGWAITFFEHNDGGGQSIRLESESESVNVGTDFAMNDRISSFVLHRISGK